MGGDLRIATPTPIRDFRIPLRTDACNRGYFVISKSSTLKCSVEFGGISPMSSIAVAEAGGDCQLADAADFHADQAFVPALDNAAVTDREAERPAAGFLGRIEDCAVVEPALVVHLHRVTRDHFLSSAHFLVFILQAGCGGDLLGSAWRTACCRSPRLSERL